MAKGLFITLEGGEGAGKTTQIRRLQARLEKHGHSVIITREPGGSQGAEQIRKLLVEGETLRWDSITECLLLFAARRDHIKKTIAPALAAGQTVISDRFYDSTYAYQGFGQGLEREIIDAIRMASIGNFKPDMTLLLDLPVDIGLGRAAVQQRYERMGQNFHEKLRQGFLQLAAAEPERFTIINANNDVNAVEEAIWEAVKKRLNTSRE